MEILDIKQGSDEWLEARLNHFCASEAPAVMNESKYMTRNQLLDLKKGWMSNPNSGFKERLFQKGHEFEADARTWFEIETCDEYTPVVGKTQHSTLHNLLASFDGLSQHPEVWEHKSYNEKLAENIRNGVVEPHHYWQLEHQMLVADTTSSVLMCSNGNPDNMLWMTYKSEPERRKKLIAGWKQFRLDLETHKLKAKAETVIAETVSLPIVRCSVHGSEITTNIRDCLADIKVMANRERARTLESDQDFAGKEQLNKDVKKARATLKGVLSNVESEFLSYSDFAGVAKELDGVLQKMQSSGEAQVKQEKARKKQAIIESGKLKIAQRIADCNAELKGPGILDIMDINPDWVSAIKNKRTIESVTNAADSLVAQILIDITGVMDRARPNLEYYNAECRDFSFIFNDLGRLLNYDTEPFKALVTHRITEHTAAETKRLEAEAERKVALERDKIRMQEERKARDKVRAEQAEASAQKQRNANEERKRQTREEVPAPAVAERKEVFKEEPPIFAVKTEQDKFMDIVSAWGYRNSVSKTAIDQLKGIFDNYFNSAEIP